MVDEDGDGVGDPSDDNGKDLSHLVPETEVAWDVPPSFNNDPQDMSGGGGDEPPPEEVPEPSGDLRADLGALRTAEKAMLVEARALVDKYEETRALVAAVKGTVFGQGATDAYERGETTAIRCRTTRRRASPSPTRSPRPARRSPPR